jgi:hypothetical protein
MKGKTMNLKFAVVSFGICLFGSALSMESDPVVEFDVQAVEYNERQNEAIEYFVNEVADAWAEGVKDLIYPETKYVPVMRTLSTYGINYSQASHRYHSSILQFRSSPSKYTYKKFLEAQLRIGILHLELLESAYPPGSGSSPSTPPAFYPTPQRMIELLPNLIKTLGLTVYPSDIFAK